MDNQNRACNSGEVPSASGMYIHMYIPLYGAAGLRRVDGASPAEMLAQEPEAAEIINVVDDDSPGGMLLQQGWLWPAVGVLGGVLTFGGWCITTYTINKRCVSSGSQVSWVRAWNHISQFPYAQGWTIGKYTIPVQYRYAYSKREGCSVPFCFAS